MRDAHFVLIKTAGLNLILSRGHPPVAGKEVFVLRRPPRRTALPSARLGGGKGYQAGRGPGSAVGGKEPLSSTPSQPRPRSGERAGLRAGGGAGGGAQAPGTYTFQTGSRVSAAARRSRAAFRGPEREVAGCLEPGGLDAAVDRVGLARGARTPAEPRLGRRRG